MGSHSRIYYMDNLRAFAMLLGVFFHASLAYSPMLNQLWPTAAAQNSAIVDIIAFFSHIFRMPLFFIIAGFFCAFLIHKRGITMMLKNRLLRIATPFAIFLPLALMAIVMIFTWAIAHVEQKSPMLGMIAMMASIPDAPQPPPTTSYLWFLYNLIFFYILAAVIYRWGRVNWSNWLFASPFRLIMITPVFFVPALLTQYLPLAAPEQFTPQLWSFANFGLFFMLGCGLFNQQTCLNTLRPYRWYMLGASLVLYGVFYWLIPHSTTLQDVMAKSASSPSLDLSQLVLSLLHAYIAVLMCFSCLVFGKQFLNTSNGLLKLIADSSYWIYLMHLPVLWIIQFMLLDTTYSWWLAFLISSFATIIIGLISYFVFIRYTPIGWLLNGRQKKMSRSSAAENLA